MCFWIRIHDFYFRFIVLFFYIFFHLICCCYYCFCCCCFHHPRPQRRRENCNFIVHKHIVDVELFILVSKCGRPSVNLKRSGDKDNKLILLYNILRNELIEQGVVRDCATWCENCTFSCSSFLSYNIISKRVQKTPLFKRTKILSSSLDQAVRCSVQFHSFTWK